MKKDIERKGIRWKDMKVEGGGGKEEMKVLRERVKEGNEKKEVKMMGFEIREWEEKGEIGNIDKVD